MREGEVRECCGVWLCILSGCSLLFGLVNLCSACWSCGGWIKHQLICQCRGGKGIDSFVLTQSKAPTLVTQPPHIIDVEMSASRVSQEVKAEFGREC